MGTVENKGFGNGRTGMDRRGGDVCSWISHHCKQHGLKLLISYDTLYCQTFNHLAMCEL